MFTGEDDVDPDLAQAGRRPAQTSPQCHGGGGPGFGFGSALVSFINNNGIQQLFGSSGRRPVALMGLDALRLPLQAAATPTRRARSIGWDDPRYGEQRYVAVGHEAGPTKGAALCVKATQPPPAIRRPV